MDLFVADVRYAWRSALSSRSTSAAIASVLAIGVGLVTVVFSLADPFLNRPLPYERPHELAVVLVGERPAQSGSTAAQTPTFGQLRGRIEQFAAVAAYQESTVVRLTHGGTASAVRVTRTTPNFLDVVGASPRASVLPYSAAHMPLLLMESAFRRVIGNNEQDLGKSIPVQGGGTAVVAGVLPKTFVFPESFTYFPSEGLTFSTADVLLDQIPRGGIIARLRPGVKIPVVRSALASELAGTAWDVEIRPLDEWLTRGVRSRAIGALVAASLVLFACVGNVANLLIARGAFRRREFATRLAIGASRRDLTRLAVIELGIISAGGIFAGIVIAALSLGLSARSIPEPYLALGSPQIDIRAIAMAAAAGFVVMILAGTSATPAWRGLLRASDLSGRSAEPTAIRAIRFVMIATQTTLGVVLLIGAALLIRSHVNLVSQHTGFRGNVLVVSASYAPGIRGAVLQDRVEATLRRLQRLGGVREAAAAVGAMADRLHLVSAVVVDGRQVHATWKQVTPGYFDAVGSTLIAGRFLTAADSSRSGYVISESLLAAGTSARNVIGQRVGWNNESQIVGVIKDEMNFTLDRRLEPTVFTLLQNPWNNCGQAAVCGTVTYVLGLQERSTDLREVVRREIAAVDSTTVVLEAVPIRDRLLGTVRNRSFSTLLLGFFAAATLGVCATGLFGVVAFVVSRRTREIAIRRALGAQRSSILALVLRDVIAAAVAGLLIGLALSRAMSRYLEHLVYGIEVGDMSSATAALVFMLAVIFFAATLPALRSLKLSPALALRIE